MNGLSGYDNWLSAPYDKKEDAPEPTAAQFDQAFDNLVAGDTPSLYDFTSENPEALDSLMRIYRTWDGIPGRNISEQMDQARDAFEAVFKQMDDGYRSVVANNGELAAEAEKIAIADWEAEIQDSINASQEP